MSDVIFATTRWNYDSYSDFRRLVELSGYPLIYVDEIDPNDAEKTYIISPYNDEWAKGWPDAKARIIFWDLEWRNPHDYPHVPGVSEIWASDPWYAQYVGVRFVLLGSHPDLNLNQADRDGHFDHDVAFLAYMGPWRRSVIEGTFINRRFALAPNGWGEQRHRTLSKSRLMVHVHQWDEFPCIAPQRWAIAAAYKLPMISESVRCEIPELDGCQLYTPYNQLADTAHEWLDNGAIWYVGQKLYNTLCVNYTFRKCVEAAL